MNNFCNLSGQKINLHKLKIAFSSGVEDAVALRISTTSGIPITTQFEKYLGVPSIMGLANLGLFQHLLDRIDERLEGWKSKYLTLAGRIILAKVNHHVRPNLYHAIHITVDTMGPGSAQPKSPKEIRPKSQPTQECPGDLLPRYPKRTEPKSPSAQERPANPPLGCLGTSYPGCLFTQMFPFTIANLTKRSYQPTLHDISKISHEPVSSPPIE